MSKCVIYSVDNNFFYKKMLFNSISMLRKHNKNINVFIFLINFIPDETSLDFLIKNKVDIIKIESNYSYFQYNKKFFSQIESDEYLILDCDTFIFGDVEQIFYLYSDFDMAAVQNDWVYSRSYPNCEVNNVFNSGVFYCKKKFLNCFCANIEEKILEFDQMKYPKICEWLLSVDKNMYNKEEFAFSLLAKDFNCCFFEKKHSFHPKSDKNLKDFFNTIIFHSFSSNWNKFSTALTKKSAKKIKVFKTRFF